MKQVCDNELLDVILDSYNKLSLKEGKWMQWAGTSGALHVAQLDVNVPIPQQLDKFWVSSQNKQQLQTLVHTIATSCEVNMLVSPCVQDQEVKAAKLQDSSSSCTDILELASWIEEADERVVLHVHWAVRKGAERVVMLSNDTDTIAVLLYYI